MITLEFTNNAFCSAWILSWSRVAPVLWWWWNWWFVQTIVLCTFQSRACKHHSPISINHINGRAFFFSLDTMRANITQSSFSRNLSKVCTQVHWFQLLPPPTIVRYLCIGELRVAIRAWTWWITIALYGSWKQALDGILSHFHNLCLSVVVCSGNCSIIRPKMVWMRAS